ncbi:MAG: TonB-dependent receptor [Bacteroidota bacterium]
MKNLFVAEGGHTSSALFDLKMKLTLLFVFCSFFGLLANTGFSQSITLNIKGKTVERIIDKIEATSQYTFVYNTKYVDLKRKTSLKVREAAIENVLIKLFEGTKTSFEVVGTEVFLKMRKPAVGTKNTFPPASILEIVQQVITGTVTDANGIPLAGASILEKGTTNGVQTDFDGVFSIELSDQNAVLVFSYIGFGDKEIQVNGPSEINVVLEESQTSLDEVVLIGYGSVRKEDLTGAVANVDGEDLTNLPSPRVDQLLQGRMAGVNVTSVNGAPGARASIRIRGGNSVSGDNEPLYVIDGFVAGTDFDLNTINVNDIASIDVLKDASSISIYGTRGANGVILITTKNGEGVTAGKPTFSIGMYSGIQEMARKIDYMNGLDRAAWAAEFAEINAGGNPFETVFGNTDWQDELTQAAAMNNVDFSVSGNNENVNYFFSTNFLSQDGIVINSGLERYTVRANLDFKLSKKLRFGTRLNMSVQNTDNSLVDFGGINGDINKMLTSYPSFADDGSFWGEDLIRGGAIDNPLARVNLNIDETKASNILGNFYLEYEPIENLIFKSTFAPSIITSKNNTFLSGNLPTRDLQGTGGLGRISNLYRVELLQENTVSYSKVINDDNRFDVLVGFTWQTSDTETSFSQAEGIPNDILRFDNLAVGDNTTYQVGSGFQNPFQLVSWIGRANYSYKNRYLLTLTGRVDGSSRFAGSDNQYGFFPSAAFAWRVIDEPFMENVGTISDLKLRASYGSSGSQAIGALQTQALFGSINFIENNTVGSALQQARPANPELRWETTDQLDIGLELGLLNDRLSFEVDYYHKKTEDLLLPRPIASQTGFASRLENVGSLENRGVELLINSVNIDKDDFRWTTTLNLAANRSEVLDIGGDLDNLVIYNSNIIGPATSLIVGEPVGVFTGVDYLGTWRDQAQIDQFGYEGRNNVVGGPRFRDTNEDGVLNLDDQRIIGDPEPTFYGGLQNTINYKNLTLNILFQGSFGGDLFNELSAYAYFGLDDNNLYQEVVNRWTPENPDSRIPRAGSIISPSEVLSNSELVEDGTFIRLSNVRLSYDFDLPNNSWLNGLSVFATGSNLFLISDFRGFDPEALSATGGGFDNVIRGFIRPEYPMPRTITFGFNAKF